MPVTSYAIALGSNRRSRFGSPAQTVRAAANLLNVDCLSSIRETPALGPAGRNFANAAAILSSPLPPSELMQRLKQMEKVFGRRRGRDWGPRVLDLDIILWSGGAWEAPGLTIPHPEFRKRLFVLEPLAELAPLWHDPVSGSTVRHLLLRAKRRRPVDQGPSST